jgi:hypothetical protein
MPACKNPLKIGAIDTADCIIPLRFPSSPVVQSGRSVTFHLRYLDEQEQKLTFVVPTAKDVI